MTFRILEQRQEQSWREKPKKGLRPQNHSSTPRRYIFSCRQLNPFIPIPFSLPNKVLRAFTKSRAGGRGRSWGQIKFVKAFSKLGNNTD